MDETRMESHVVVPPSQMLRIKSGIFTTSESERAPFSAFGKSECGWIVISTAIVVSSSLEF